MAELILFEYSPGTSLLHKIHPLIKLITMLVTAVGIFYSGFIELVAAAAVFILAIFLCRLPLGLFLRIVSFLMVISILIYGSLLLDYPVDKQAVFDRTEYFVKLMCFLFIGLLFMSTTSATSIRGAVYTVVPSVKIALLITFFFAFLPQIFFVYKQTAQARKLRMPYRMMNPVQNIVIALRSFLAHILISGDTMADAYTLRCPSDKYAPPSDKIRWYDVVFLGCSSVFTLWALCCHLFLM